MDNIKVVAVDAMGGDNAPVEIVKGCVEAVKEREDIKVLLACRCGSGRTDQIHLSDRPHRGRTGKSGYRDSRTTGYGNTQKERFVDRCGIKTGQGRQGGWLCFRRQFRGGLSGRTSDRW